MTQTVDLRSDTVTQPTPAMREAMLAAPLGDDVLGDDPTVQELESHVARLAGKEGALYCPSGTMTNQIALAVGCERGDAILVEEESHVVYYEVGAPAILAGALTWTLPSDRGVIDPDLIRRRVLTRDLHRPETSLLCVENTHNRHGGAIVPLDVIHAYRRLADETGLRLHLDGARLWNAAVAAGTPLSAWCAPFDTVSLCLSKGLGAPVGSLLLGTRDTVERARRWRKRLGGGMRQSGLLAAAGLYAVRHQFDRLADDHRRARRLAERIGEIEGFCTEKPETNIVLVHTPVPAAQIAEELGKLGVRCFPVADRRLRLVTHLDVDDDGVERAVSAFLRLRAPASRAT